MKTYHHISISQFLKLLEISRSLLQQLFFWYCETFCFLTKFFQKKRMKLPYPEVKSQTGLSSLRVSYKRILRKLGSS